MLCAVFFLMIASGAVHAQEAVLHITSAEEQIICSLTAVEMPTERIFTTLDRGLRSRITFTIRVLRKVDGFSRLFGDRVLVETTRYKEVRLDPFSRLYQLTDGLGTTLRYRSRDRMMNDFLHLSDIALPVDREAECYAQAYVRLDVIRLTEPLKLLSPYLDQRAITTPSVRVDIP